MRRRKYVVLNTGKSLFFHFKEYNRRSRLYNRRTLKLSEFIAMLQDESRRA